MVSLSQLITLTLPPKNVSLAECSNSRKENGNGKKNARARYTLKFKQEAVRLVEAGQSIAAAARTLGVVYQTLCNWVKAQHHGKLQGADSKVKVSAEQMEISRLRTELARVKKERDILGKATAYFAKGSI